MTRPRPRARRFVADFVGQWLQTRDVEGVNVDVKRFLKLPNDEAYRIFNQRLRIGMRDETELLFAHLLVEAPVQCQEAANDG